jgi:hypothetical protein
MQLDPIFHEGGINLYEYVQSNPINNTDKYGLFTRGDKYLFQYILKRALKKETSSTLNKICKSIGSSSNGTGYCQMCCVAKTTIIRIFEVATIASCFDPTPVTKYFCYTFAIPSLIDIITNPLEIIDCLKDCQENEENEPGKCTPKNPLQPTPPSPPVTPANPCQSRTCLVPGR